MSSCLLLLDIFTLVATYAETAVSQSSYCYNDLARSR